MELLVSNNQAIADLAADDEKDDFGRFDVYIIQNPKVANAEFEFRQRIGAKRLMARVGWAGCSRSRARTAASKIRCSRTCKALS
jgi:hypothetical protein